MAIPLILGNPKWSPAALPHLAAWYRADDAVVDNGKVSRWNDRSGNNVHLNQSTATHRPDLIQSVSQFGGKPALHFDGTRFLDWSGNGLDLARNLDRGLTLSLVINAQTTGTTKYVLLLMNDTSASIRYGFIMDNGQKYIAALRTNDDLTSQVLTSTSTWSTTDYHVMTTVMDLVGGAGTLFQNGTVFETDPNFITNAPETTKNSASGSGRVGANIDDGLAFNGYIAEIILTQSAIDASHQNLLNTYYAQRYGQSMTHVG